MKNTFKEDDKKKVVDFLNHIAKHAQLTHSVQQSIEFFKLLNYMQTELIPKINDNILEIKKVVETSNKDF